MEDIEKTVVAPVEKLFKSQIVPLFENKVFRIVLTWLILVNVVNTFNASTSKLPSIIIEMATSIVGQIISLFFVAYYTTNDFRSAVLATLVYISIFFILKLVKEKFELITKTPDIMIGCTEVTVADLLDTYNGDEQHLRTRMFSAGVPENLELNDLNAPLISSYLVGHGDTFSASCTPPQY
jgi:hypothetical protein